MNANVVLITGPVRSGKSRFAEALANEAARGVTYVATAAVDPTDLEWNARLEHHRRRRAPQWKVVETAAGRARGLPEVLRNSPAGEVLLVDSLGTWLADRMGGAHRELLEDAAALEAAVQSDCTALLEALLASPAELVILVGEETGWGIVPEHRSGRIFRDQLGRLQADIAAHAQRVYLVVSGIAIDLRSAGVPVAGRS